MTDRFETAENQEHREYVYYPACFCGILPGTFGITFFGSILVLIGGVWLLDSLNILPVVLGNAIWPLALITIGLGYLGWVIAKSR